MYNDYKLIIILLKIAMHHFIVYIDIIGHQDGSVTSQKLGPEPNSIKL